LPIVRIGRRSLANLPTVSRPTVFYDDSLKGFGLRVTPSGARSWIVEYRPGHGGRTVAKRRMTIGSVKTLTPEKARETAGKILARVELGEDPARLRSEARRGASLGDLLDAYLDEHIKPKRKPHTKQTFTSYANVHIRPALGDRTANTITSVDVSRLHRTVGEKHPVTANRLLVLIHAANAYGAKARLLPVDFPNPSEGIERFRESGRERYLTEVELLRLGDTLRLAETEGLPWEPNPKKKIKHAPKLENRRVRFDAHAIGAIRLLLLTGCRLREILHLKWSEHDLNRGLLFLPDSKTGKKTIVLGAPAMVVLSELPRLTELSRSALSAAHRNDRCSDRVVTGFEESGPGKSQCGGRVRFQ
jgi:integrase